MVKKIRAFLSIPLFVIEVVLTVLIAIDSVLQGLILGKPEKEG